MKHKHEVQLFWLFVGLLIVLQLGIFPVQIEIIGTITVTLLGLIQLSRIARQTDSDDGGTASESMSDDDRADAESDVAYGLTDEDLAADHEPAAENDHIIAAKQAIEESQSHIEDGQIDDAESSLATAQDHIDDLADDSPVRESPTYRQVTTDIEERQSEITSARDAEAAVKLKLDNAWEELEKSDTEPDTAPLEAAAQSLEARTHRLPAPIIEELRAELDDLQEEYSTWNQGVRTELSASEKAADTARRKIRAGKYDDAQEMIEAARTHLRSAKDVNTQYDLGYESQINDQAAEIDRLVDTKRLSQEDSWLEESTETDSHGETSDTEESEEATEQDNSDTSDRKAARQRLNGLFGSITSNLTAAETALNDDDYEHASNRLNSTESTLETAIELQKEFDFETDERLAEFEQQIETLRTRLTDQPREQFDEQLATAEAAVQRGIDAREQDEFATAVDEFSTAVTAYETAHEIATTHEYPAAWETQERQAIVEAYLDVAQGELAEERDRVNSTVADTLETVADKLTRATQFAEVDDTVAARETLRDAVQQLDETSRLVTAPVADDSLKTRHQELVTDARALHTQLPTSETDAQYRSRDLVESLQELATKLTESPSPELLNKYGEYPADAYLEAFGSWGEALAAANLEPVDEDVRERRKYTRVDVLDALVDVAAKVGRRPDKSDMNEYGTMSASPVSNRFVDWVAALDVAGIQPDGTVTGAASSTDESTNAEEPVLPPNELAETYEAMRSLESLLSSLISADDSVSLGDGSPLAEWYRHVSEYVDGDGRGDASCLGKQQGTRTDISINDYREAYGDGDRITDFTAIEAQRLDSSLHTQLVEAGVIASSAEYYLPIAPESREQLPLAVRTPGGLETAGALLNEFPPEPAIPDSPEPTDLQSTSSQAATAASHAQQSPKAKQEPGTAEESTSSDDDIVDQLLREMEFGEEQAADD